MSQEIERQVVWQATLDERYDCRVERIDGRRGELTVEDTRDGRLVLLRQTVTLSYGAVFGPDIQDVREWEVLCEKVVDQSI